MRSIKPRSFKLLLAIIAVAFALTPSGRAQRPPLCDSGGVCGPDSTDPSYGGLIISRAQKQNARGSRNPLAPLTASSAPTKTVIGSQSYNKAIPILSLPGRGLDLNLTLYYNSRVWTVDTVNNTASFNVDRDFPSPGFRLDFGYIEFSVDGSEVIVTESDGSKHALILTANTQNGSLFDSMDGTAMEYNNVSRILSYRDGTTVTYEQFPIAGASLMRPIKIMDRNRNYVTITYVPSPQGQDNDQHINTITDTLNRIIKYNYDGNNHLQSITQAVNGSTDSSGTHTWATFTWATPSSNPPVALTYKFSTDITMVSTATSGTPLNVLTGCVYPNQTGYKFSYQDWGIVNRIDQLSAPVGNPPQPYIRAYETYAYPDTSQALTDAPRYQSMTASPDNSSISQWNYSETQTGKGQVVSESVTDPLGTVSIVALNNDGTLNSIKITDSATPPKLFRQTAFSWTSVNGATLPSSITTTDDAGNNALVSYGYDNYSNVTDQKEYDFDGTTVLRETVTSYKQGSFTAQHILNLPATVQIKDGQGVVQSRTDFDYDTIALSSVSGLVQNDGNATVSRGNLTFVARYTNPSAAPPGDIVRTFTYDAGGNLIKADVDCCNQKKFNFDPATQYAYLSSIVRGPDVGTHFTTTFTFNPDNGLLSNTSDENGQQTSYQYDGSYRLTKVIPPLSNGSSTSRTLAYADDTVSPQVTTTTDVNSTKIVQYFDGLGHMSHQDTIDSSNGNTVSTTQFQYDEIWRRKKTSNPYAGSESLLWNTVTYDPLNRVTAIIPPTQGQTNFTYIGQTVLITDPANKRRKNFTDALGRLVRVDEPGWGDALSATDSVSIGGGERSVTTTKLVCAQYAIGGRCVDWEPDTVTDFDTGNVTVTFTSSAGNGSYTQAYGQFDTPATIATNLANKINVDPARMVNASPSNATIGFTAVNAGVAGNSIQVSVSSGTTDAAEFGTGTTSFPASTFTPALTGGEDAVTQANAVLSASRHLTTTYTYDVFDHLVGVSQGALSNPTITGQPRSYAYDHLGRLTSSTTPESGTVNNYYTDAGGNACSGDPSLVCRVLDARSITKNFSYDPLNRLTGISYSDGPAGTPPATYQYDVGANALDRLTMITDGSNSQTFTYDNLGRVTQVVQAIDSSSNTYTIQYAYNPANQLTTITYPSGRQIKPDFDTVGRLNHIKDPVQANPYITISSADYTGAGLVKQLTMGNGVIGDFSFNDHLQLSTVRYHVSNPPAGTADVLNLKYDYTSPTQPSNNGQIQAIHYYTTDSVEDQTRSESFTYDQWSRLLQAQTLDQSATATWNLNWTYDRLGNRLAQSGTGNGVNIYAGQLTVDTTTNRITTAGYAYDNAGNMTHDASASYTYDGANRLTGINNGSASYTYFGRLRIKKTVSGSTTIYIYSGSQPIAEYAAGAAPANPSREYVYAGAQLLASVAGSSTIYYHRDHLSNRAETDSSGNATRRMGHFPFGENWYDSNPNGKWKFTTYERDLGAGETGLDYAQFRYYSAAAGRFTSTDLLRGSVDIPQSMGRYGYVINDPVNFLDPLGLIWVTFELRFCTNSGAGDSCSYEQQQVWLDDGGWTSIAAVVGGGGANGPRRPNKITCNTVLPDGTTVGSQVNSVLNTLNQMAENNLETNSTAVPEAQTGVGVGASEVYTGLNFKITFMGQANAAFLGDAGNFAYGAISADLGIPLALTEAVAGAYAKKAGHSDTNNPYGMDNSASQQIPLGYTAKCQN